MTYAVNVEPQSHAPSLGQKIKRENETFLYSQFVIGNEYSKLETMSLGNVTPPQQARDISGITRFKNCVVLFVTLNKERKDSAHQYHDIFHIGGKMFQWDSQNHNTIKTPHMQMIINHDPVILFARVNEKINSKTQRFLYVGQLRCNRHIDSDIPGKPIEVMYDVLDFSLSPNEKLLQLYNWSQHWEHDDPIEVNLSDIDLIQTAPPQSRPNSRQENRIREKTKIDWEQKNEQNCSLGLIGEKLVVEFEKQYLISKGLIELALKIEHVSLKDDNAGYDIKSYEESGREKYIEVKSTKLSKGSAFYISRNEVEISNELGEQYWIYRVYDLKNGTNKPKFYALNGAVENHFELIPDSYKARIK